MGLFFKKEKFCSICNVSSKNETLFGFDITSRGEFSGSRVLLCKNDLYKQWLHHLDQVECKIIAFFPIKGWNSYCYTTFGRAKEWDISDNSVARMQSLLGKLNPNCDRCGLKSKILLIENAFSDNILDSDLITKSLCSDHYIQDIIHFITENNCKIDEINTPFGSEGLYMHGEY